MKLYFSVNHQEEDYQLIYVNGDVKNLMLFRLKNQRSVGKTVCCEFFWFLDRLFEIIFLCLDFFSSICFLHFLFF